MENIGPLWSLSMYHSSGTEGNSTSPSDNLTSNQNLENHAGQNNLNGKCTIRCTIKQGHKKIGGKNPSHTHHKTQHHDIRCSHRGSDQPTGSGYELILNNNPTYHQPMVILGGWSSFNWNHTILQKNMISGPIQWLTRHILHPLYPVTHHKIYLEMRWKTFWYLTPLEFKYIYEVVEHVWLVRNTVPRTLSPLMSKLSQDPSDYLRSTPTTNTDQKLPV